MHRHEIGSGRLRELLLKEGRTDSSPLRSYYLSGNDLVVYTIAINYFSSASRLLWTVGDKSFIRKTVGIQALFDLLKKLSPLAIEATDISEDWFTKKLNGAAQINFSDDFFQASGAGRTRIRNSLEIATGLKTFDEISDVEDQASYRRLLRKAP